MARDCPRIVADANMQGVEALCAPYGEVRCVEGRHLAAADVRDADVLLVRSVTRVDRALLAGSRVRFVGTATSGLEHIDRDYLAAAGIAFAHARGANANAVVEYALAAIAASGDALERLLEGATLGIVGQGHVGRHLRACARALGIGVRVSDPWLDDLPDSAPLSRVLASEVVSLHPELTRRAPWPSYHLLNPASLRHMSPQALLINASRGAVVDHAALLAHLRREGGPRCVLDVWEHEPRLDPALLEAVHLGTPHIAGYSEDARLEATRILARALAGWLQAAPPAGDAGLHPAPALNLPQCRDPVAQLRAVLAARYDIQADDRALRAVVVGDSPAAGFDGLRRHYPLRRELRGSAVEAPGLPRAWAEALGLVSPGGSD